MNDTGTGGDSLLDCDPSDGGTDRCRQSLSELKRQAKHRWHWPNVTPGLACSQAGVTAARTGLTLGRFSLLTAIGTVNCSLSPLLVLQSSKA